jgi:uncharacterized membrane protein YjgN (DUF898 family)
MEKQNYNSLSYKAVFNGKGGAYFGILIVNFLLNLITLTVYYPWARARRLRYLYNNTTLNNENLTFSGTPGEMFLGYLKLVLAVAVILAVTLTFVLFDKPAVALLFFYMLIILVAPFILHGTVRYGLSRSWWRDIRFGYKGKKAEFFILCIKNIALTIITFGIYAPWFINNIRKYIIGNSRMGDAYFNYDGKGGDFFILNLKGYVLSMLTLGIYAFWWQKDRINYFVNNLSLQRADKQIQLNSSITGFDFFKLQFVNVLMTIFSLGIAYPWAEIRYLKFIAKHLYITGDIDPDTIRHTDTLDTTGEEQTDFLDIDFII